MAKRAEAQDGVGGPGKWLVLAAMFVAALIAYWPALRGAFIGDDFIYLPTSEITRDPAGWWRAWVATGTQDYYPLTYTLWWLMWRAWGPVTWPYHLVNVALHTASAWLIWRTLRAMAVRGAVAAAWLWLLHPLNVAGVAWMAELKDTLSMLFFVGAIRCYVEALAGPAPAARRGWYCGSIALFAAALLSKTAVV